MPALGALTGGQAVQMVKAGLEAIYLSGWRVERVDGGAARSLLVPIVADAEAGFGGPPTWPAWPPC